MILQELKNYYDRKSNSLGNAIAPEGWEWKEIPFVLVIRENGTLVNIEDTREGEGKKDSKTLFSSNEHDKNRWYFCKFIVGYLLLCFWPCRY